MPVSNWLRVMCISISPLQLCTDSVPTAISCNAAAALAWNESSSFRDTFTPLRSSASDKLTCDEDMSQIRKDELLIITWSLASFSARLDADEEAERVRNLIVLWYTLRCISCNLGSSSTILWAPSPIKLVFSSTSQSPPIHIWEVVNFLLCYKQETCANATKASQRNARVYLADMKAICFIFQIDIYNSINIQQ